MFKNLCIKRDAQAKYYRLHNSFGCVEEMHSQHNKVVKIHTCVLVKHETGKLKTKTCWFGMDTSQGYL